jgi:hypothetical protein
LEVIVGILLDLNISEPLEFVLLLKFLLHLCMALLEHLLQLFLRKLEPILLVLVWK